LSEKEKKEAASKTTGKIEWIFAVEEFQKLSAGPQVSAYVNQALSAAVDKDLKVSGKKDEFLIDPRQVKSKSKVAAFVRSQSGRVSCRNAGGAAFNGTQPILDVQPTELHQRTPLIIGGAVEMAEFERCLGRSFSQ
jgi:fructose-1,6-bisphosphatase I